MKFGLKYLLLIVGVALSVMSAAADKNVLGKLGQAVDQTAIRASMSLNSRIYYKVKKYEYLIINSSSNSKWVKVLLQNGQNGYILSQKVARLPYNVTAATPQLSARVGSSAKTAMLNYAFQYVGTPYKWGGNDLKNGIDCSGFVKKLFGGIGVNLPRTARDQANVGQEVSRLEYLQPGDRLYFWDKKHGRIGHTGIFLGFFKDGGAYFIHSSSGRHGVATDDLRNAKWRRMLVQARR